MRFGSPGRSYAYYHKQRRRRDPVVGTLRVRTAAGPVRLSEAMRELMVTQAYSRFGAWKAVQRAIREGAVSARRSGREVWLECL